MKFKDQVFLVYGLGLSGVKTAERLLSLSAKVLLFDDDPSSYERKDVLALVEKGVFIYDGESLFDVLAVSPGIPIDRDFIVREKRKGTPVVGEIELGFLLTPSPIIAVSGTNGKTTVSTILYSALKSSGEKAYLSGNVGAPLIGEPTYSTPDSVTVTEVSSFQLETVAFFRPHIAVMLNITQDHLDRHYTMENYVYLKKRLFANMGPSEYAVLNYDDLTVRAFAKDLKCKVVYFSALERVDGAYIENGSVFFKGEEIFALSALKKSSDHDVKNALAVVATLKIYGLNNETVMKSLTSFVGVKHRLEKIAEIDGVTYFDDSKATNVNSALSGALSMTVPTVMILGGVDKGQTFNELFEGLKETLVHHAVLLGEARFSLINSAREEGFENVSLANSFESAVKIAQMESKRGGAVLLSPACASFDMFENYKERGEMFASLVGRSDEV